MHTQMHKHQIIGWRRNSVHLVVFITDANYHVAGDGKVCYYNCSGGECVIKAMLTTYIRHINQTRTRIHLHLYQNRDVLASHSTYILKQCYCLHIPTAGRCCSPEWWEMSHGAGQWELWVYHCHCLRMLLLILFMLTLVLQLVDAT